jgi:hypothetical protein
MNPRNTDTQSCYLLFSTTSSLLSRSIRWATQATVSHAAIAYECATTGRVMVLEAAGTGFRGLTWETWIQENDLLHAFRIDVPTGEWQSALGSFCDTLGAPYDSRRLVLELARHLSRDWTQRFSWANTQKNSRGVLCADAVAKFLYQLGFSQFQCPPAWTPGTLLAHVKEEESFVAMSVASSGVRAMPLAPIARTLRLVA